MNWYYNNNGQQAGPLDEAALEAMANSGTLASETLVWREGMENWAPYSSVAAELRGSATPATMTAGATRQCAECGGLFPPDELIQIGGGAVCAACKPIAVQKLKEGVPLLGEFHYGGFWIRAGAKVVDSLILWAAVLAVNRLLLLVVHPVRQTGPWAAFAGAGLLFMATSWAIRAFYSIWFVGKYSATPGKMACGLRVIRSSGEALSYGRATARFFAEILSGLVLCIGYLMVAFDDQKRGLHDRLCDTRVIYK